VFVLSVCVSVSLWLCLSMCVMPCNYFLVVDVGFFFCSSRSTFLLSELLLSFFWCVYFSLSVFFCVSLCVCLGVGLWGFVCECLVCVCGGMLTAFCVSVGVDVGVC
jgi:hypothetical protein